MPSRRIAAINFELYINNYCNMTNATNITYCLAKVRKYTDFGMQTILASHNMPSIIFLTVYSVSSVGMIAGNLKYQTNNAKYRTGFQAMLNGI